MKKAILVAALFIGADCPAQLDRTKTAPFYPSLPAYSTQGADAFSLCSNSASLANVKSFSAGVFSERRFMLPELSAHSFALALPVSSGVFGLGGTFFGGPLYRESALRLAHGRNLGSKAAVGVQFHYLALSAAGYGAASTVTFDAGALFRLTEAVQVGFSAYNPVRAKLEKNGGERLPSVFSAGIGYDASPQVFVGAEAQKSEGEPLNVSAALQYAVAEKLFARLGVASAASVLYGGFGAKLKALRIDLSASFHPYLGVTPGFLVLYTAKK